ncbi:hypothetical protein FS935_13755 [Metabacillus litoralis]|uniref:LiaI-LiaF-like transmembrane region domain-containing protein n=1 Tax=Metabacillus litoralis TaxID=152268 RepID=A0A5C6VYS4_9BACI|nr:DUF5668 domain-containing protein [Metabacillus litoralis]TXC90124.1 hypothetical protein FS935_13755 [Metabacillus litoralis]
MKNQKLLPAIILLALGIFYSIQNFNIHLFNFQNSWQMLLILLGFAFLISGHFAQDFSSILPGVILTGLGVHFIYYDKLTSWPDHPAAFLFILAIGMILTSIKTKTGYVQGFALFATGLFLHFFQKIIESITLLQNFATLIEKYWPLLLIIIGSYLLLMKKRK